MFYVEDSGNSEKRWADSECLLYPMFAFYLDIQS